MSGMKLQVIPIQAKVEALIKNDLPSKCAGSISNQEIATKALERSVS